MTRKSVNGSNMLSVMRKQFRQVPDQRELSRITYKLEDILMCGVAMFSFKTPSLLQFEEMSREDNHRTNLKSIFNIDGVPSDTQFREVLDEVDPGHLKPIYKQLFGAARESKVLDQYQFLEGKYLLAGDGSGQFYSDKVHCEHCMRKVDKKNNSVSYYHRMFAGCLVHPELKTVIPLCPEPMKKQDVTSLKNDDEKSAAKRFVNQFREDHPKLDVIFLGDALHATGPMIKHLTANSMSYILSAKPGSHKSLFAGVDKWDELGKVNHFEFEEEIGEKIKKKRIHQFRYTNGIILNHSQISLPVNYLEYWETTQWVSAKGEMKETMKHFSWVTNLTLYESNITQIMRGGRARWKIENETFNTLKNQGYEFEHNFGHGYKYLTDVLSHLMMIVFLFDQLQEAGCELFSKAYQRCNNKKIRLWGFYKSLYNFPGLIESWDMLMKVISQEIKCKIVFNST